jgi:ribosomal protein L29
MEYKELKKKKASDLHRILNESRDKLRDLKFKDANKQLKDIRQIRKTRAIIAQCLTLLNKQETDTTPEVKPTETADNKTNKKENK